MSIRARIFTCSPKLLAKNKIMDYHNSKGEYFLRYSITY